MAATHESYYRRPRTTQERRQNPKRGYVQSGEYKVKVRPKRCKRYLPNSWWDLHRCIQKSWKKQRKTQYHILKESTKHEICNSTTTA